MVNYLSKLCDKNVVQLAWKPKPSDKRRICFYRSESGNVPAVDWMVSYVGCSDVDEFAKIMLAPLSEAKQTKTSIIWKLVYYLRERIATWQLPKTPKHYRPLKTIGCHELKHETGRLIGFYDKDIFIVVHGFEKKTKGKTPKRHLDAAKDRKSDYEKRRTDLGLS